MNRSSDTRPHYSFKAKLALAIASAIAAVLAAECLVRAVGDVPTLKSISLDTDDCVYRRSTNPILGFELKADYRDANPDYIQSYERTNAHGLRDKPRKVTKPEGVLRVLLLGDSVVEGYGLPQRQTISARMERLFGNRPIEVLNFGTSAYCTLAEVELLRVKGLKFEPDVVVLVFVENDFHNFNREAFALAGIDRPAIANMLFEHSQLCRMAAVRLDLFHFGIETDPLRVNQQAIGDNNVARALSRLRGLADEHGFKPAIAIWPQFRDTEIQDMHFLPESDTLIVEGLAAMYDIPTVRLSRYFREDQSQRENHRVEEVNPRLLYSSGDRLHPSSQGSMVAARAVCQIVDQLLASELPVPSLPPDLSTQHMLAAAEQLGVEDPTYARVHTRGGNQLLKSGRYREAAEKFQQAIELEPDNAVAINSLGVALERMGRLDEASDRFKRAITLDPDLPQAHFNLARVLLRQGHASVAVRGLQMTLRADPKHYGALNLLGMTLARQGKHGQASEYLRQAVQLDPENTELLNNLAVVLAAVGQRREAVELLTRANRLDPSNQKAAANLRSLQNAATLTD